MKYMHMVKYLGCCFSLINACYLVSYQKTGLLPKDGKNKVDGLLPKEFVSLLHFNCVTRPAIYLTPMAKPTSLTNSACVSNVILSAKNHCMSLLLLQHLHSQFKPAQVSKLFSVDWDQAYS